MCNTCKQTPEPSEGIISRRKFLSKLGLLLAESAVGILLFQECTSRTKREEAGLFSIEGPAQMSERHLSKQAPTKTLGPTQKPAPSSTIQRPTPSPTSTAVRTRLEQPAYIPHDEWAMAARSQEFIEHHITRITLHHEGVYFDGKSQSEVSYLQSVQRWGMNKRGWEDFPYHFIIGLDGVIYEGRPLWAQGDTNTSYDTTGHGLIALLGNYDDQEPNKTQLDTIALLMAWLVQEYAVPASMIMGHRDFFPANDQGVHYDGSEKVTCPGNNLYAYLQSGFFHQSIKELLGSA